MLPASRRVTSAAEHRQIGRRGRRAAGRFVVVHVLAGPLAVTVGQRDDLTSGLALGWRPARAGLAVGKSVGNSVVRHRVSRRLRHLLATRLPGLPPGSSVVVRALPSAAGASSAALGIELDHLLSRARRSEYRSVDRSALDR